MFNVQNRSDHNGRNREFDRVTEKKSEKDIQIAAKSYEAQLNWNNSSAIQHKKEDEKLQKKSASNNDQEGYKSKGAPKVEGSKSEMPARVQAKMEHAFGTDFSGVEIHKNDNSATQMNAQAYTQGNSMHFAPGQYSPETSHGQELLGHELTHVVQQNSGRVAPTTQGKGMLVNDSPALESEADIMGKRAAEGKTVDMPVGNNPNGVVQRKTTKDAAQGELGLYNENVSHKANEITVSGTTEGGREVRPQHYQVSEYASSDAKMQALEANYTRHAFMEIVAHKLAYLPKGYKPIAGDDIDLLLKKEHYQLEEVYEGEACFQYVYLKSLKEGQNDILGLRGTYPKQLLTIFADLDPEAIGLQQYRLNNKLVKSLFERSGGKLDVCGHSLGGALAQIVTAHHTAQVGNLFTFQAPGISTSLVNQYNDTPEEDRPNVNHHVMVGDMVDKAGEQNIPGNVYSHDYGFYWKKTYNLLDEMKTGYENIVNASQGIKEEQMSILKNFTFFSLKSMVPFVGVNAGSEFIVNLRQDLQDIKNFNDAHNAEIKQLLSTLVNVGAGIGQAHMGYMFTSDTFKEQRQQAGFSDSLYEKPKKEPKKEPGLMTQVVNHLPRPVGPAIGLATDYLAPLLADKTKSGVSNLLRNNLDLAKSGEYKSSVVTAHESYPYQDERSTAENMRNGVGNAVHSLILSPEELEEFVRTFQGIRMAAKEIQDAIERLNKLVEDLITAAGDKLEEIKEEIKYQLGCLLEAIGRFLMSLVWPKLPPFL